MQVHAEVEHHRQAIRLDSTFAVAYATLGRRLTFLGLYASPAWFDSGFVVKRKALALEPDAPDLLNPAQLLAEAAVRQAIDPGPALAAGGVR